MAKLIDSERITLTDGRLVQVRAYEDGSVRFNLSGAPYMLAEAWLPSQDKAIIKLVPVSGGSNEKL